MALHNIQDTEEWTGVDGELNKMAEEEHRVEESIIKEIRNEMKRLRSLRRNSKPGEATREARSIAFQKDPDPALNPGTLSYESTPRELEKWISSFKAYLANGTRQEPVTVIAYIISHG